MGHHVPHRRVRAVEDARLGGRGSAASVGDLAVQLAPQEGGTLLTEWMQMGPGRSGLSFAIDRMPEKEQKIVFVRMREFEGT